ncbi:MAG: hypothetical protein ACRELY_09230 [Polyangiaceae bacterium]
MTSRRKNRVSRALVVFFFAAPGFFALACTETRRGLGEECLKGEDCISNLCVAQICAAAPPLLQGTPGVTSDGASEESSVESDASDASEIPDVLNDVTSTDAGDDAD